MKKAKTSRIPHAYCFLFVVKTTASGTPLTTLSFLSPLPWAKSSQDPPPTWAFVLSEGEPPLVLPSWAEAHRGPGVLLSFLFCLDLPAHL